MADWQVLSITGAVIIGIVLLIIKVRLNPVVALIIGALTLGVATGMTQGDHGHRHDGVRGHYVRNWASHCVGSSLGLDLE